MEALVGVLVLAVLVLAGALAFTRRNSSQRAGSENLKTEFQTLSQTALSQASEDFLRLAEQRFKRLTESGSHDLQGKKDLIDQQLQNMKAELSKVTDLVRSLEKDREAKFGQLTTELKNIGEQTVALTSSTSTLREALASSRSRGQWGERMAEDILRLMGLIEGVNYDKQKSVEGGGSRPDFIFILPGNLKMNMDVKFPLDNYLRYLEAESEAEKSNYESTFLRDVRTKINEVSSRQYIDPAQGTVDYALLFIPNESVYAFIHEKDSTLLEAALRKKVIWCSPLTLYCVLAVVRQAVDNFALARTSDEIISLMGSFNEQWKKYLESMSTLGDRITKAQNQFETLNGTRRRALERPLDKIEQLRKQRQLPVADAEEDVLKLPISGEDAVVVDIGDSIEVDEEE